MELFELYLTADRSPGQFTVAVTQSAVGEEKVESQLPWFEGNRDWRLTLLKTLEANTFDLGNFPDPEEQAWMVQAGVLGSDRQHLTPHWLRTIGQSLYQALFPPGSKVKELLQSALRLAESHNTQLHLRLKFDAKSDQRSRLADYPWELIHDGDRFLAQHQVTFSRYIAHDTAPPNLPTTAQITVLLVSSGASDPDQGLKPLALQEQQAIRRGLERAQQAGYIQLVDLEAPTLNALRTYLTEQSGNTYPQVLHFDGHGLLGKRCLNEQCRTIHKGIKVERCRACGETLPDAQGYLVFEQADRRPDYVSATELGTLLQQTSFVDRPQASRGITLAVLSACQSGMSVVGDSVFNGMAQSLIGHRVPAVVAMQYSVGILAATHFAEQFYRSLGQKNSLAVAISQGREAMGVEGNQWYRPVLYLRWRDNQGGQLFGTTPTPVLPPVPTPVSVAPVSGFRPSRRRIVATSLVVTGIIFVLRLMRLLEWAELKTFDHLMQSRFIDEGKDPRLVIVQVTDKDIKAQLPRNEPGQGTVKDPSLDRLLDELEKLQPRLIGVDFYRDFKVDPSVSDLEKRLRQPNIVSVCLVADGNGVAAPEGVPSEQVGFADFVPDDDKTIRRYILAQEALANAKCSATQSFGLLLAQRYIALKTQQNQVYADPFTTGKTLQIGKTDFAPLQPIWGGYQNIPWGGYQIMLNYRATGGDPAAVAPQFTMEDVFSGKLKQKDIKDKLVLIGSVAGDKGQGKDEWTTPYGELFGVVVHAHLISQMISAVEDGRSPLRVLPAILELLWIWGYSLIGAGLVYIIRKPRQLGIAAGVVAIGLYLICLGALSWGSLWLPLVPSLLALGLTGLSTFQMTTRFPTNPVLPPKNHDVD